MVISLVNQKGGVGKTTLAVNIAGGLARGGEGVLLVDADPQGSVMQWQAVTPDQPVAVRHLPRPDIAAALKPLRRGVEHIVIDSPPALGAIARGVLAASDLVVVPVTPSPLDIWSSRGTLDLIAAVRRNRRRLRACLVISRRMARTRLGQEIRDALEDAPLPVLAAEVSQRVVYMQSMLAGRSVFDFPRGARAAAEITRLCDELVNL